MGFFHHAGKHKSYAIIGLGRFGTALAIELCRSGEEILVLDSDEERVNELREYTENAFVVQHIDKKSLMETGVQNCDVAIVCIGSKMDISILTTLHLTALEVPRVIAKATSAEHGDILERLGAEADFVICLYNPSSRKRADYLARACRIIGAYRGPDTVCGYAVNIGRQGETCRICTLRELAQTQTDMFTTVFIGNSQTREADGQMITPRGYEHG